MYALVVDDHASAFSTAADRREALDKLLNEVPLAEEDPETWGMSEAQERAVIGWLDGPQVPTGERPDVTH